MRLLYKLFYFISLSICICPINSYSRIITVGPTGDYTSIYRAMIFAENGDEIIVSPGIYYENIDFWNLNVTLRSIDPDSTETVAKTIIDGGYTDSTILFYGSEETSCVLSGFTIRNGRSGIFDDGGGIQGRRGNLSTKATIRNNIISGNETYSNGGGIAGCNGLIENNIITYNSAIGNNSNGSGGGIFNCSGIIRNNIIAYNFSEEDNGGICGSNGIIINNKIFNNIGDGIAEGDGQILNNIIYNNTRVGIYSSLGIIKNNLIYNNFTALYYCYGDIINNIIYGHTTASQTMGECTGLIMNNIFWGNNDVSNDFFWYSSTPVYSCIQNWTGGGEGNISVDPMFVDAVSGDFRLMKGSPCIDAGNPAAEYFDACIPPGRGTVRNDMGAYGGPQNCGWDIKIDKMVIIGCILGFDQITPSILPQLDQNNDSKIDVADLIIFVNEP